MADFFFITIPKIFILSFFLVVIHNNWVVLNTFFFSSLPAFKKLSQSLVLVVISLDRALFLKCIRLPLAYLCLRGECRSKILLHILRKSLNPSSFSPIFLLLNSDNKRSLNLQISRYFLEPGWKTKKRLNFQQTVIKLKLGSKVSFLYVIYLVKIPPSPFCNGILSK